MRYPASDEVSRSSHPAQNSARFQSSNKAQRIHNPRGCERKSQRPRLMTRFRPRFFSHQSNVGARCFGGWKARCTLRRESPANAVGVELQHGQVQLGEGATPGQLVAVRE